jgi:hypothetical protein
MQSYKSQYGRFLAALLHLSTSQEFGSQPLPSSKKRIVTSYVIRYVLASNHQLCSYTAAMDKWFIHQLSIG